MIWSKIEANFPVIYAMSNILTLIDVYLLILSVKLTILNVNSCQGYS